MALNKNTQTLAQSLAIAIQKKPAEEEEPIEVSKATSALAVIYEAARNAVEFRADHLIRQGAINRILKRRLFLNQSSQKLALLLIKELLWARYLEKGAISKKRVSEVQEIIERYRLAVREADKAFPQKQKKKFTDWLVGLASCEIEEHLVPKSTAQLLINYVYQTLRPRIEFPEEKDQQTKDFQVYIAVERSFAQNNELLISYRLLKIFFPEWIKAQAEKTADLFPKLTESYRLINNQLNYYLKDQIRRIVSRRVPPFNLIRDLIEQSPQEFIETVGDEKVLEDKAVDMLLERYHETSSKLVRAAQRSIIYIFLTKMVFALLLEYPVDLYLGKTNYKALAINAIFPPFLMFILSLNINSPNQDNTNKIIEKVKEYLYLEDFEDEQKNKIEIRSRLKLKTIEVTFLALYSIAFIFVFGIIISLLNKMHFNPVSQLIFIFFVTIVSFFAYRVRLLGKDYLLQEEEKEGIFGSLIDFIFLPILRVGQWLSIQISNFNLLIFIFDFIIEAPLKAILEVVEEWIRFVRLKKEEIIT